MIRKIGLILTISIIIVLIVFGLNTKFSFAMELKKINGETPSGIPLNELEEKIDQYVSQYLDKTTPGAAIIVVKDGQIILSKGYGYADVEKKIPVDPSKTVFEWGSISKLFTWTSAMQLVEQGKLDLDEDIKTYLPSDFAKKLNFQQTVTMRDLMNHAAGFGDYAFNTIAFSKEGLFPLKEALLLDKSKQYYKVGTASSYSNYGASLAGYVVESISKQPFHDYEREHLFNVLEMNNTTGNPTFDDNKKLLETKAKGYLPNPEGGFLLGNWSYVSHYPAGSINGTAEDLAKYAIAITPEKGQKLPLFNNSDTLETMFSPSYSLEGEMVGTAHGFFEYVGEYRAIGHGGNTATFSSQFAIVPEERFGIVILTNASAEMDILFGVQELLIGKKHTESKVPYQKLPSSNEVDGKYVPFQRQEGNFLEFANYQNLYTVSATNKNEITMSIGQYKGTYVQTKPYYYELVEENFPIFRNVYPILQFKMEEGKVKQIIVGHGMDLSELPPDRTIPVLIASVLVLLSTTLYFLITPLILLILKFKNRKKELEIENKKFNFYYSMLILCGTTTVLNNLICITRIMMNKFRTFVEIKPHLLLNYPLLVCTVIAALFSIIYMRKIDISKKSKVLYFITIISLTLLFTLLIIWNFFIVV